MELRVSLTQRYTTSSVVSNATGYNITPDQDRGLSLHPVSVRINGVTLKVTTFRSF